MINMLIWNIRGIAGRSSVRPLRKLLRLLSISFLVILEPMVEASQLQAFIAKFGFHLAVWNVNNKIWVLWKADWAINVLVNSEQFMHMAVTHSTRQSVVFCSFVYAKCTPVGRQDLWAGLTSILGNLISTPWMMGGDFNVIVEARE